MKRSTFRPLIPAAGSTARYLATFFHLLPPSFISIHHNKAGQMKKGEKREKEKWYVFSTELPPRAGCLHTLSEHVGKRNFEEVATKAAKGEGNLGLNLL